MQDRVNVVEVDYRASRDAINALTNTLNEISDELEDVKIQMDERGNKMRDTSPVVQIKQCITQIKVRRVSLFFLTVCVLRTRPPCGPLCVWLHDLVGGCPKVCGWGGE